MVRRLAFGIAGVLLFGSLSGCQTARIGHTGLKVPVPSLAFIGLPWPGLGAGNLQGLTWENAFVEMKGRMQTEYPFTEWKGIDWNALEAKYRPRVKAAQEAGDAEAFYLAVREFLYSIPDGHIGISDEPAYRRHAIGGGFGFAVAPLDDGHVIAIVVDKDGAAEKAGMKWGAEILAWNGRTPGETAASEPVLWASQPPATTAERVYAQYRLLTRAPVGASAKITFKNEGGNAQKEVELTAYDDGYTSLEEAAAYEDALREESDPFDVNILPEQIGYIKVQGLGATLTVPFPERALAKAAQRLLDADVKGLILDMRRNRGGSDELAAKICGHFFRDSQHYKSVESFDPIKKTFTRNEKATLRIEPQEPYFGGPIVILIDGSTIDAGEGIVAALKRLPNVRTVGANATHGSFATTGGGLDLPKGSTVFYPVGRALDEHGKILLESDKNGKGGVDPDVNVDVTRELLHRRFVKNEDVVLERGLEELKAMIAKP